MGSLAAKIAAVGAMTPTALRAAWTAQDGGSADGIPPSLLARALAQQLQTSRFGGLEQSLKRHLDRLCGEAGKCGGGGPSPLNALSPGSQLLREWGETTHKVLVLDDGLFRYDGRDYRSLSSIAKHITGAHWSGPRFFGLGR